MAQETQTHMNHLLTSSVQDLLFCVDRLNSSLLFQLSLSSKELFHSNFFAWIAHVPDFGGGRSGKSVFREIFQKLGIEFPNDYDWELYRENKHFDLSIIDKSNNYIAVIENKVKSVPTLKQLEGYSSDFKKPERKPQFLLLSLVKEFIDKDTIQRNGWIIKNYGDLANAIKSVIPKIENQFYKSVFEDYLQFITELNAIVDSINVSGDTSFLLDEALNSQLKTLRIDDLVQKIRFSVMAVYVENFLKEKNFDLNCVEIATKYTYSGGALLEIWVPKEAQRESSPALCIQIQANRYAHAVYPIPNNKKSFKKVVKNSHRFFASSNHEFQKEMLKSNDIFDINCHGKDIPHLTFGKKSSTCFAYQYAVIKKDTTVRQLAEQIASDLPLMLSHLKIFNNSQS